MTENVNHPLPAYLQSTCTHIAHTPSCSVMRVNFSPWLHASKFGPRFFDSTHRSKAYIKLRQCAGTSIENIGLLQAGADQLFMRPKASSSTAYATTVAGSPFKGIACGRGCHDASCRGSMNVVARHTSARGQGGMQHACWWDAEHTLNSHSENMGPVTTLICTTKILP